MSAPPAGTGEANPREGEFLMSDVTFADQVAGRVAALSALIEAILKTTMDEQEIRETQKMARSIVSSYDNLTDAQKEIANELIS